MTIEPGLKGERSQPNESQLKIEPDEHRIRKRAYQIWEEEGRPNGRALDHWLRAHWEIREEIDPEAKSDRIERLSFMPLPSASQRSRRSG